MRGLISVTWALLSGTQGGEALRPTLTPPLAILPGALLGEQRQPSSSKALRLALQSQSHCKLRMERSLGSWVHLTNGKGDMQERLWLWRPGRPWTPWSQQ